MDYEFLMSAPPKITDKFQDMLYIDEEEDEEGGLNVISEKEDESSQSITQISSQQQNYAYENTTEIPVMIIEEGFIPKKMQIKLKTFREEMLERQEKKQLLEKQFKKHLREQTEYLLKQQKEEEIKKKLSIKNIEPAIKEMLYTSQIEQPKPPKLPQVEQKVKSKLVLKLERQIDDLKAEVTSLKIQHQNDEELLKTLKIQIKKQNDNMVNSTANTSSSFLSNRSEYNKEEIEKLQQEIVHLKKTIFEERESFKTKMGRVNKVNSALYVKKQENSKLSESSNQQFSITQENFTRMSCQIAELRNQVQKLNEKISDQDGLLNQKEKEICSILNKLEGKQAQKIENKIQELETEITTLKQDLTETKESMMIDNQLSLLYPKHGQTVLRFMSFMMHLEENKNAGVNLALRFVTNKINQFLDFTKKKIQKLCDYIAYRFAGKQDIKHPSNQELIRLAVNRIRVNPTIIEKKLMEEEKCNKLLKENIHILEKQIDEFKEKELNTAARHKEIEVLHRIDKVEIANNIMVRIMKKEAEDDIKQSPELEILKRYVDLIYKNLRDTDEDKIKRKELQQKEKRNNSKSKSPKKVKIELQKNEKQNNSKSKSPKKETQSKVSVVVRPVSSSYIKRNEKLEEKTTKKVEHTQLKKK